MSAYVVGDDDDVYVLYGYKFLNIGHRLTVVDLCT